jgi:nucleotide-binding universal stress UspA family protein
MKVLLAVDGSPYSEAAARSVIDRFNPSSTEVRVLHAVEWMKEMPICLQYGQGEMAAHDVVASRDLSFQRARGLVEDVASQLESKGFSTTVATPDAEPRHAIVDAARDWHADLVVMCSHGRRGIDRFFLGSVAESVVRHSPCSVEIVRLPAAA